MPAAARARLTSAARSGGMWTDSQPSSPATGLTAPGAIGRRGRGSRRRPRLARPAPGRCLRPRADRSMRTLADDAPGRDDPEDVDELLDLAEDVARHEHGLARRGELLERRAHGDDAGRVEPVRRLVEEQQARVAQQGGRDAEPLLHPERIGLDAVLRPLAQADELEELLDPRLRRLGARWPPGSAGSRGRTGRGRTTASR